MAKAVKPAKAAAAGKTPAAPACCSGCRYWRAGERRTIPVVKGGVVTAAAIGLAGECRRMPPAGIPARWPTTLESDWCGEWEGKR